jgi:RHS repeat-associated protein
MISEKDFSSANRFLFSTKMYDSESDSYYYGYRNLSPRLGRWLSRDPINENNNVNLYSTELGVNKYDFLGMCTKGKIEDPPTCSFTIANYLGNPEFDQNIEDLVEAMGGMDKIKEIMDVGGAAVRTYAGLMHALEELGMNKLDASSVDIDKALSLYSKIITKAQGVFGGWKLSTRINYRHCECGMWFSPTWVAKESDWKQFIDKKSAYQFPSGPDVVYQTTIPAIADGPRACAAHIKEFREEHKDDLE